MIQNAYLRRGREPTARDRTRVDITTAVSFTQGWPDIGWRARDGDGSHYTRGPDGLPVTAWTGKRFSPVWKTTRMCSSARCSRERPRCRGETRAGGLMP